jgi:hypothetical protein
MPPGGVHLACGVALARWGLPLAPRIVPARHGHALRTALVVGSIVPVRPLALARPVIRTLMRALAPPPRAARCGAPTHRWF